MRAAERLAGLGLGLGRGGVPRVMRGVKAFCVGVGPSSTTQSLRSIRDVLRPRLGGDGEGDAGWSNVAVRGDSGVSKMESTVVEAIKEPTCSALTMADLYAVAGTPPIVCPPCIL